MSRKEKGIKLSRIFQNLNIGDKVALVKNLSVTATFPARLNGKTGIIEAKKGNSYIVKIKDNNQEKLFVVKSTNLKKLK